MDINYSVFTDEVIIELSKTIEYKQLKKEAVIILEFLKDSKELCLKKDLIKLFDKTALTVYKYIEQLEYICAVSYKKIGNSYVYSITPVGLKLYDILTK